MRSAVGVAPVWYLCATLVVLAGSVLLSVLSWVAVFTLTPYISSGSDYPLQSALLFAVLGSLFLAALALAPGALLQWASTVLIALKWPGFAAAWGGVVGLVVSVAIVGTLTLPSGDAKSAAWLGLVAFIQALVLYTIARHASKVKRDA